MLIGRSQRRSWYLPMVNFPPPAVDFLTEAFAPQLFEPKSKFPQRLRIRKQHQNVFFPLAFQYKLDERCDQRRVFSKSLSTLNGSPPGALHQRTDIQT